MYNNVLPASVHVRVRGAPGGKRLLYMMRSMAG